MTSNYEVVKEIGKDVGRGIAKAGKGVYNNRKKIYDFGKYLIGGAIILPSAFRNLLESEYNFDGGFAGILGVTSGVIGRAYFFSSEKVDSDMAVPLGVCLIATNVASGIYEYFRYKRNKLEERERNNELSGNLEQEAVKVQTPITKKTLNGDMITSTTIEDILKGEK